MNKKQIILILGVLVAFIGLVATIGFNSKSGTNFIFSQQNVIYIEEYETFEEKINSENIVVLGTSACPYCQEALPIIEEVAKDLNMEVYYIQLDEIEEEVRIKVIDRVTSDMGENWGVPLTLKYIDGELEDNLIGLQSFDEYSNFFSELDFEREADVISFFGAEFNTADAPLLLSTFIISFIDGFNPCSLWVLTLLLGIVVLSKDRKKILLIGLTYLTVAALAYGAFILGMINVFSYIGYLFWIRILVAAIATTFALVNIKDFFFFKKGISFTISDKYKPKIFSKVRNLMRPDNNTRTLIIGSAIMALGITLVELPCTAGFPMIWSNIISAADVSGGMFATLFGVYILTYFSVELAIFLTVVYTLKVSKFEEKHGRLLKLIGGVIMLALAMVLVFNPDMLNDITATIVLFGGAIISSILIAYIYESDKFKGEI